MQTMRTINAIALVSVLLASACIVELDDLPDLPNDGGGADGPEPCRSDDDCDDVCAGERVCTHDCTVDEHCDPGQACVQGSCYVSCTDDDVDEDVECGGVGVACLGSGGPGLGVCGFESLECGTEADCAPGQVCGDTRACSDLCDNDDDCAPGLVCPPELGYCSAPCDNSCTDGDGQACDCDDAMPGAVCELTLGVCWYQA